MGSMTKTLEKIAAVLARKNEKSARLWGGNLTASDGYELGAGVNARELADSIAGWDDYPDTEIKQYVCEIFCRFDGLLSAFPDDGDDDSYMFLCEYLQEHLVSDESVVENIAFAAENASNLKQMCQMLSRQQ